MIKRYVPVLLLPVLLGVIALAIWVAGGDGVQGKLGSAGRGAGQEPVSNLATSSDLLQGEARRSGALEASSPIDLAEQSTQQESSPREMAQLNGVVVDASGTGVAHLDVTCWQGTRWLGRTEPKNPIRTKTASNGTFSMDLEATSFVLTAEGNGWTTQRGLRGEIRQGEKITLLEMVVSEAQVCEGTVVNAAGLPVVGAQIYVNHTTTSSSLDEDTGHKRISIFTGGRALTVSDEAGRFKLSPLPSRVATVEVKHPEYQIFEQKVDFNKELVVIRLEAGIMLEGSILTADGTPAAGAQVIVNCGVPPQQKSFADDQGHFIANGLSPTIGGFVAVHLPGSAIHVVQHVVLPRENNGPLEIQLERGHQLNLRVEDSNGDPMPRAKVVLEGDRILDIPNWSSTPVRTWERQHGRASHTTDRDGHLLITDLYPGTFKVDVRPSDRKDLVVQAHIASALATGAASQMSPEVIVFDLQAAESVVLKGTIKDDQSGLPIEAFHFLEWHPQPEGATSNSASMKAVDSPNGSFRVTGVQPGKIRLEFQAEGYSDLTLEEQEYSPGEYEFEIALSPAREVVLKIHPPVGEEALNLSGHINNLQGDLEEITVGMTTSTQLQVRDGMARLGGLPAERLELMLIDTLSRREWFYPLDLRSESSSPIEIFLTDEGAYHPQTVGIYVVTAESSAGISKQLTDQSRITVQEESPPLEAAELDLLRAAIWLDLVKQSLADGKLSGPLRQVRMTFLDGEGRSVAEGTLLAQEAGGYSTTLVYGISTSSRKGREDPCLIQRVTGRCTHVRVEMDGASAQEIDIRDLSESQRRQILVVFPQ